MDIADALRYLDDHASYEKTGRVESPSLGSIERMMDAMGDPQRSYPVVHLTGTNGKGSTTQMVTRLLTAQGLKVGTYTSPHLEVLNERICIDSEPIADDEFAAAIAAVAGIEVVAGVRPTYFEAVTAAAFRHFADVAVDVAVVEVGMLGRWDATNVVDAKVAVVTNIALDHTEFAGPTLAHIASEKVGISKLGSILVVGDENPLLSPIWAQSAHASLVRRGTDFSCDDNALAVGGRLLEVRTPRARYSEVAVPLHGRHQGDNASIAIAAVEEFFDAPLDDGVLTDGMSRVEMPGRFEVLGRHPLVVIDGAHNPAGGDVCAEVFFGDFSPSGRRTLVVGALRGRDPAEMLGALRADDFDVVICTTAPSPRAVSGDDLAVVARSIGCDEVRVLPDVPRACDAALTGAGHDDAVIIAGSLYVAGAARTYLRRIL
jgi:dihydrofolate synthase/folylpolyglutamate synthase